MGQIITAIIVGILANVFAALILRLLQKVGKIEDIKKFWSLFVIVFLIGGGLGFYAYPNVFPKQIPCEKFGTSAELTTSAWKAFDKKDFARALECTQVCINRYSEKAKEQQKELNERGSFATGDNIPKYWALNDVSTSLFIRGEVYRKMKENEKARQAYQEILNNYSYGQCWDPRGWYWKLADGANEKLKTLR